ncbi:MAG: type II toxin-antitoxin system PemK/MazF family toxin [Rhodospirillales bacterium]|nr:type II toxin-antitoxin system PemK/MazF family toxin [Rhodospirillales bacterium]
MGLAPARQSYIQLPTTPLSCGAHRRRTKNFFAWPKRPFPIGMLPRPMRPSVIYKRRDVVAIPYPFVEGLEAKRRPGLIVSTEALHARHGIYFVVMITTAKAGLRPDDLPIGNPKKAGLPEGCVIRVARLATLGSGQISHRLGEITMAERNGVIAQLRQFLVG